MSGFKKATDKCHCGSDLRPLLQEYVCKEECDLPTSMRSNEAIKANVQRKQALYWQAYGRFYR